MKRKRTWIACILLCICAASILLAGCGRQKDGGEGQHVSSSDSADSPSDPASDRSSTEDADSASEESSEPDADPDSDGSSAEDVDSPPHNLPAAGEPSEPDNSSEPATPSASGHTATLYVGTKANGFTEYPMKYEGELTPELLIQGIADLTDWNLTLGEAVVSGKGGMSVCLSKESSLFTGPPEPQKDEFHMYSAEHLAETILDSIQKTLQEGFTGEHGDPDAMDIWYYMEGEQPLELPDTGRSWPIDQPYQWEAGLH